MVMALQEENPRAVRLSLYIAIRLACLVRQFRTLIKARIKSRAQLSQGQCQAFESPARGKLGGLTKLPPPRGRIPRGRALHNKHSMASTTEVESTILLQHLDYHVAPRGHGLGTIALYDHLFLQHNVDQLLDVRSIKEASHVLAITTQLLARLPHAKRTQMEKRKLPGTCETIRYEKFIANLEHILHCLQQAARQVLHDSLELLKAEIHRWQQRKALDDDWFAEWPSGRRPLSTTWPWNIKPSLVVLWGVCWKFFVEYNSSGQSMPSGTSWPGPALSPRNVGSFGNPATTNPEYYSPGWRSQQPGRVHGARNLSENYSDAMIGQLFTGANAGSSFSGILERGQRPASNPYIFPISTSHSGPPATVATSWPGLQSIDSTLREISQYDWQPTQDQVNISTSPASQLSFSTSAISPYTSDFQSLSTPIDTTDLWSHSPQFPHPGSLTVPTMQESQSRYPTPRSEGSDHGGSLRPVMPANLDLNGQATSPPTNASQLSRRPSISNASPPRNLQGAMSCSHRECAANPPTFSRNCEWKKHMDKHTRPHVCTESGCEKIQGFTYSGGLLRHQREVHKQHGGPKAPRMCPHRDCKRSSGTGFSRKENLNEHLRRVHRGAGIDAPESMAEPPSTGSKPPRQVSTEMQLTDAQRKRRREVDVNADEQEDEPEEDEFPAQIKKLKKQLEERDKKIEMLEGWVREALDGRKLSPSGR